MPLSPHTLTTTHRYATGQFSDSWSAHIPQEDWLVHFGHTQAEAVISLLDWLYDYHQDVFKEVATLDQQAVYDHLLELCEGCLSAPVYLSVYCRACCQERGLKPDPPDAD